MSIGKKVLVYITQYCTQYYLWISYFIDEMGQILSIETLIVG